MSAEPLAKAYEDLKELRRQGGDMEFANILEDVRRENGKKSVQIDPKLAQVLDRLLETHALLIKAGEKETAQLVQVAILEIRIRVQSESAIRTLEIKTLADRIFGEKEKADAWLNQPNKSLSGQRPADLLQDELGAAVVREMLERIDHGIFA
jgi:putative toxin-antitoxin system antitoxin component (TIGR02293 family)